MSVFVSYSHVDKEIAEKMVNALEARGISCWIAPRNINAGDDYSVAIDGALDDAKVAVLVYSQKSLDSRYCKNEINTAFDNQAAIIPFKIDDSPVKRGWKLFLKNAQWIDAVESPESKFDELVGAVRSLIESVNANRPACVADLSQKNIDRFMTVLSQTIWDSCEKHKNADGTISYEGAKKVVEDVKRLFLDAINVVPDNVQMACALALAPVAPSAQDRMKLIMRAKGFASGVVGIGAIVGAVGTGLGWGAGAVATVVTFFTGASLLGPIAWGAIGLGLIGIAGYFVLKDNTPTVDAFRDLLTKSLHPTLEQNWKQYGEKLMP